MNMKQGTILELLTLDVSLSCSRLEDVLHAPTHEANAVADELEDVSAELGKTSAKLAELAALLKANGADRGI